MLGKEALNSTNEMTARRHGRYWLPCAAMTCLSFLSYVDRNTLAILSTTVLRDTGLTAGQYGWVISAFSAAYLLGNPAWGRWFDRVGVRWGIAIAVALWTSASVSHAFASSFVAFACARAALGFGEGATFPAGMRVATQTLRKRHRARGIALAYSGGSLGAIVTPLVVTPVAAHWGWRGAFVFTGILGAAWLALWRAVGPDRRLGRAPRQPVGPRANVRGRALVGFMGAYALGGLPLGLALYGAPLHLGRGLGCDQTTLGRLLWIPPLGWEIGYFFWGWVTDRAARRGQASAAFFGRWFCTLAVLSLPLSAAAVPRSPVLVLAILAWATFVAAGFVILSLGEVTSRAGAQRAGYLAGMGAGAWSAVMALLMPLFGWLFDRGAYGQAYAIAAVAPTAGLLCWLWARPTDAPVATITERP
jgi:ACS family hexuronate transporter-like MFS transporter